MAETSNIEWTDATWSPWEGCTKVSPGCDHCYAAGMNNWLRKGENWGPGAPRRWFSTDHWLKPVKWNAKAEKEGKPLKVFPSVCDPFDNEVPQCMRDEAFWPLVRMTPWITWLLLTKRIGNAQAMLPADWGDGYPNVWIGATVVNREEMLRDGPKLKAIKAAVTFWSVEPMLGDLGEIPRELMPDWVIAGGESGRQAPRPMHPDWVRSLRDQCATAGVPFLFKQWGEWTPGENVERVRGTVDTAFLTDDVWRIYPLNLATDHGHIDDQPDLYRVGKKAAGRLLDGIEHNQFPGDER